MNYDELGGLTIILNEGEEWPPKKEVEGMDAEFLIHVNQRYDQSVICMKRPRLIEAIKFLYWRSTGTNIIINAIPAKEKTKYMTTK